MLAGREGEIWVFGYGSLMWSIDFPITTKRPATLTGFRRSFCVWTALARGTPDKPGLGLGLIRWAGHQCDGLALRIDERFRDAAMRQIWDREMWTDIYTPAWRRVQTDKGPLEAIVFEVDVASRQFARDLSLADTACFIATAKGKFGPCCDYLFDTATSLRENGIDDREIDRLCEKVRALLGKVT
jgi:cation transport protein ChaC